MISKPYNSMKNWIAVASAEHVLNGRTHGFMQVYHGKAVPLRRLKSNDWVAYYSPTSFTAIGQIKEGEPYQVDIGDGFCPFRRDVLWFKAEEAEIIPLLDLLELTKNKKNWGYPFRLGLQEISRHDMQQISIAMRVNL